MTHDSWLSLVAAACCTLLLLEAARCRLHAAAMLRATHGLHHHMKHMAMLCLTLWRVT